jgi:hypothetical protein
VPWESRKTIVMAPADLYVNRTPLSSIFVLKTQNFSSHKTPQAAIKVELVFGTPSTTIGHRANFATAAQLTPNSRAA